MVVQPFFLPVGDGQRFCLFHQAHGGGAKGAILYIHPFAEEMNKARRMAALQSRALAIAGYDVLQLDLLGCGDSSGDFSDATWQIWRTDVLEGCRWLRKHSVAPLCLWGLRAGCLLATEVSEELTESADLIFWQPVVSGKLHWQQFMRLKMAGELASGQSKGVGEQVRRQLANGQSIEIAGYIISPELVEGLEKSELAPPLGNGGRMAWFELSTREDANLAPISLKRIEQWKAAGLVVTSSLAIGPAFWQTTEISDAPELLTKTLAILESWQ
ncbi:MAG: hydrolase 2, exosortase A system-associated [Gammaproteobacteria bacterium]|nr:hydrolase 2, exosortase A system-associated [Gammaproteobacteria bacterium]MBU2435852.1 hydrolase 2, exosortase A system-associated [Gammaproteobacteria bacterium]MBU2449367.1 hydrolase 2, exosortase A system-associated [Gammaproteobacteria bacterium]